MGTSMKMVVNLLFGNAMAAFAEAMAPLSEGLGLSPKMLFDSLRFYAVARAICLTSQLPIFVLQKPRGAHRARTSVRASPISPIAVLFCSPSDTGSQVIWSLGAPFPFCHFRLKWMRNPPRKA